jgi:hypothetical protein
VLLADAAAVQAQPATTPKIEGVRLGLPSGQGGPDSGRSRRGNWAPLYVQLKAGKQGNLLNQYRVAVQTIDSEETPYRYSTLLPALDPDRLYTAVLYVRPSLAGNELTVQVESAEGRRLQHATHNVQDSNREVLGPGAFLYLALGSRLPGLNRALLPAQDQDNAPEGDLEDRGLRRFAFLDQESLLPDLWIGYDAADVIFLSTSKLSFLDALTKDGTGRREALVEWVRRGGKLVISVGEHGAEAGEFLEKTGLMNCPIKGSRKRALLRNVQGWAKSEHPLRQAWIAELAPGTGVSVLGREGPDTADRSDRPILVQGSCGLGRVVLIGFDLDQSPFVEWKGQKVFWQKLLDDLTPRAGPQGQGQAPGGFGGNFGGNPRMAVPFDDGNHSGQEVLGELQRHIERFNDVPVISFGWVALFIFLYILLVGPIDYFLLKKVFKRLEWTWITFPAVVLIISVAAYFIAYHVKGEDLRINRLDLVEFDLHQPQAYGTTWFSVFSPRMKNYTLTVEPTAPEWVAPPAGTGLHPTMMTLLTPPDRQGRVASQSLFPQPYEYAPDAFALERVPVPVWAARSFTGSWRAPLNKDRPALEASLDLSRIEAGSPRGTITNHLPVKLDNVTLFWKGRWYDLEGGLAPDETRRIDPLFEGDRKAQARDQWFSDPQNIVLPKKPAVVDGEAPGTPAHQNPKNSAAEFMKALLFHTESQNPNLLYNSGVRTLDQSWRIRSQQGLEFPEGQGGSYRDEIVLVARTAPRVGLAQAVNRGPATGARLWLDALPDGKAEPPRVEGFLDQETYIRAYIPVQPNR